MRCYRAFDTPVGVMSAVAEDGYITHISFGEKPFGAEPGEGCPLLGRAEAELLEYFAGRRREFSLPLRPAGTPFQTAAWAALARIPYGETRTYGQLAAAVGNPKACRAVGMANNKNPIVIVIPCHRVVGADGSLVGFGGGLDVKRFLLALERGNRQPLPSPDL